MSLTSITFLIFLLACVVIYYLLAGKTNMYILLLFSVVFYAYAMPRQLLQIMVFVWIVYGLGLLIKKKQSKAVLIFGIIACVVYLAVYKSPWTSGSIIVPIGISYITFQSIAYLVEVYKNKMGVVKNPVAFFLYILFFPKITAGPIEPPKRFFDNLYKHRQFKWNYITEGIMLISMGFVKKLVFADMLAPGVARVFDNPGGANGLSVVAAMIMYSFQIYFDFSGYTDIARGSAKLFGIDLIENFRQPYLSTSVGDFWRRWHISLSEWLKNYIYIPLGGSRVSRGRRFLNVLITFLVSGAWHGTTINFIIWGLLHGLYQVVEIVACKKYTEDNPESTAHRVVATVRTFVLVTIAWVFFRADNLKNALAMFKNIFTKWKNPHTAISYCLLDAKKIILMIVGIVLLGVATVLSQKYKKSTVITVIFSVLMAWLAIVASFVAFGNDAANTFIYFNF